MAAQHYSLLRWAHSLGLCAQIPLVWEKSIRVAFEGGLARLGPSWRFCENTGERGGLPTV